MVVLVSTKGVSPNFLKQCSNALKIAISVGYSEHTYSSRQMEECMER